VTSIGIHSLIKNTMATAKIDNTSTISGVTVHVLSSGYRGCQKNVPIAERFFATTLMPPSLFLEHSYDKRYKWHRMPSAPTYEIESIEKV
jgi:hypothetical protein